MNILDIIKKSKRATEKITRRVLRVTFKQILFDFLSTVNMYYFRFLPRNEFFLYSVLSRNGSLV